MLQQDKYLQSFQCCKRFQSKQVVQSKIFYFGYSFMNIHFDQNSHVDSILIVFKTLGSC